MDRPRDTLSVRTTRIQAIVAALQAAHQHRAGARLIDPQNTVAGLGGENDTETSMLSEESAMCVQRLDDSRSAIRITYRISLRSSSSQEPRYPLLKVVKHWSVSWGC